MGRTGVAAAGRAAPGAARGEACAEEGARPANWSGGGVAACRPRIVSGGAAGATGATGGGKEEGAAGRVGVSTAACWFCATAPYMLSTTCPAAAASAAPHHRRRGRRGQTVTNCRSTSARLTRPSGCSVPSAIENCSDSTA